MAVTPESPANPPHSEASSHAFPPLKGKRRKWPLLLLLIAFIALTAWVIYRQNTAIPEGGPGKGEGRRGMKGMPMTVTVSKAGIKDINVYLDALGTITPRNNVVVNSRVDGQLLQLYFTEGQMVKAGDLLAQIDPKPYEAQLAQVAGQLARDQALLENALIDADRYNTLLGQDSISRQQVDTQASLVRQYRGAVEVDKAQVDNAKLQLGYARITAPISGRIGLRQVDPGNMIRASDTNGIVTITQLQPITALFNVPEDRLSSLLKRINNGTPVIVEAWDRGQQNKLATGKLLTVDNQIDTTTGTVKLRAQFDNRDNALFPNQFVNIKVLVDVARNATVVPVTALQHGRTGDFVYVMQHTPPADVGNGDMPGAWRKHRDNGDQPPINDKKPDAAKPDAPADHVTAAPGVSGDGHKASDAPNGAPQMPRGPIREVKTTPVTVGPIDGNIAAVLTGLKPGDVVVTDGADKLKDGAKIRPVFAESNGKGKGGRHRNRQGSTPGEGMGASGPGSTDASVNPDTAPSEGARRQEWRHRAASDAQGDATATPTQDTGTDTTPANGEKRRWRHRDNPDAAGDAASTSPDGNADNASPSGDNAGRPGAFQHGGHRQRSAE